MKVSEMFPESKLKKSRAALAKREKVLRAQVQAVCQSYTNALFVHGPGGLGKTHIITSELEAMFGRAFQHHTAYSTPKALIMTLAAYPEQVHLFEDCEGLYKQAIASSILRAACGSPKQKERWVTYESANERIRLNFRGGVIIVSNENISRARGPLAAVASRFRPIEWNLSVEERITRILDIASEGWTRGKYVLGVKECREAAAFLVGQMLQGEVDFSVDLRTFTEHVLPARAQFPAVKDGLSWKEVVKSKLRGYVQAVEKRTEKTNRLQAVALQLSVDKKLTSPQKVARWKELTGLGQAIFYRHLREAKASGSAKQ